MPADLKPHPPPKGWVHQTEVQPCRQLRKGIEPFLHLEITSTQNPTKITQTHTLQTRKHKTHKTKQQARKQQTQKVTKGRHLGIFLLRELRRGNVRKTRQVYRRGTIWAKNREAIAYAIRPTDFFKRGEVSQDIIGSRTKVQT